MLLILLIISKYYYIMEQHTIVYIDANTAVRGDKDFDSYMRSWGSFLLKNLETLTSCMVVFKEAHRHIKCSSQVMSWEKVLDEYFPFLTLMGMVVKGDEGPMAFGFVMAKYGKIPDTWRIERQQIGLYERYHYDTPTRCSANAAVLIMDGDKCIFAGAHLTLPISDASKKAWRKEVDDFKALLEDKKPITSCSDMNWLTSDEKEYCDFSFLSNHYGLNENDLTFVACVDDTPLYKNLLQDVGGVPEKISFPFGPINQGVDDKGEPKLRPCSLLDLSHNVNGEHFLGYPSLNKETVLWEIIFTDTTMTLEKALEIKKSMTPENPYRMDHFVQLFYV